MAEPAQSEAAVERVIEGRLRTGATRQIWLLAWPAVATNLLQSLVGFVDIKIVGSLGAPAVAAVTTGNRLFFVQQILLMALGVGTTALVARAWGAGDRAEAERVTRTSLWLGMGVAGLLTIPGIVFAHELAAIFRLDEHAVDLAATFIRWLSVFNLPFAVGMVLGTSLRAAGDTRTPLWIGAIANVLNVAVAYTLVYGAFGIPALGVAGAAIANGTAFCVASAITLFLWLGGRLPFGVGPPGGDFDAARIRRLTRVGSPAGLEQLVVQAGFIGFLWIVALYGTAPYAAYGIGVNILSFSFLVGLGFSIAASTLVGQHLGALDPEGAERAGWRAMFLAMGAMFVFGGVIIAFAAPIARFMIDDAEVVRLTAVFIRVLGSVQVLMAIEFTLGGALRGAGDTRFPLLTVALGLVVVRLGLATLFVKLGKPVEWVFAALIGDYLLKGAMLVWRFRKGTWRAVRI